MTAKCGRHVRVVCSPLCVCLPFASIEAMQWQAERSPAEVMEARENVVAGLESASAAMRASGACESWYGRAEDTVRRVSRGANGRLLTALLEALGYGDVACADLLRDGACV